MDEKELIEACRECSVTGQRLLYRKHAPFLRGVCSRYLRCGEDAKDALQEAFVEIFKCIPQYKGQGSFEGWLKKIAIHTCIDHLRKNRKFRSEGLVPETDISETPFEEAEYLQLLDLPEYEKILLEILHDLPPILSVVFNLFYIDDLPHKEIAALLKIDEVTSRTRLSRAKQLIKEKLTGFIKTREYARFSQRCL
jgi:RNA polymerase sigma-70 factor, ECF subfamily